MVNSLYLEASKGNLWWSAGILHNVSLWRKNNSYRWSSCDVSFQVKKTKKVTIRYKFPGWSGRRFQVEQVKTIVSYVFRRACEAFPVWKDLHNKGQIMLSQNRKIQEYVGNINYKLHYVKIEEKFTSPWTCITMDGNT